MYPYSCDPLKNESHPDRIFELYTKAQKTSGRMYTINVPDGIANIIAPKLEPSARPPQLTEKMTPLMAAIMFHQLDKILSECDPDKPILSWLYIYETSPSHIILRDALVEAYNNKGQEILIEPIKNDEKKFVAPQSTRSGKK